MDKKRIYTLLITATILTMITAPLGLPLTPPTPTPQQAQPAPTRNPTTPPQKAWSKAFGGSDYESAHSVQQTSDGGYIIAGDTHSFDTDGPSDFWLVKTDLSGNRVWNKTYGGDVAWSVQQTGDGGYIMAGYTYASDTGDDYLVVKTDDEGGQLWARTFGGADNDIAHCVQRTGDGGYIIAGFTESSGVRDLYLIKLDAQGYVKWSRAHGGSKAEDVYSIQRTSDGGYVVAGDTWSYGAGGQDFWLVKTDSLGNMVWNKTYGGGSNEAASSVQQTPDGGYIVAGSTYSFGKDGSADFWLVKTDLSGNRVWNKTYGGSLDDYGYSVQCTGDGGYIIAGSTKSLGEGEGDFWLVKTDSSGKQQWNVTYGGDKDERAESIQCTSDGGYIIAGYTYSFGAGKTDFWLVKTKDASPPSAITDLTVTSPTSDSLTLTWTAPGDEWNTGTAKGYVVKYSTTGQITEANWDSAAALPQSWNPGANGTTETHTISGLSANTKYWFAIKAYDEESNYGSVSNSPSGTTLAAGLSTELLIAAALAVVAVIAVLALILKKKK